MGTIPKSDLLHGAAAIAEHLHMTRAQVFHLHARGDLPTFKIGRSVCARARDLDAHFAALAGRA